MNAHPRRLPLCIGGLIAVCGATVESVLLASVPGSIYQEGLPGVLLGVALLFFLWVSGIDLLTFVVRTIEKIYSGKRTSGLVLRGLFGLFAGILLAVYCCSWGVYFRAERFVNIDALQFLFENPIDITWSGLGSGERVLLSVLVLAAFATVPACAVLCPRIANVLANEHSTPRISRSRLWQLSGAIMLCAAFFVVSDANDVHKMLRLDKIRSGLNPLVTLASDAGASLLSEPIPQCLDDSELTALTEWAPPAEAGTKRPSILFIALESLRADVVYQQHQGMEITPNLNRLAANGRNFTRAYSQSTHSDYADVCIVSSLYPKRTQGHHYYKTTDPWPRTLAFDVFKPAGYSTAIISSQNEAWGGMDRFLQTPNLDFFYDAKRYKSYQSADHKDLKLTECDFGAFGKLPDHHTMDTAIAWIQRQTETETPFFLSMNFQSSHFPYELPEDVERPFQPCQLDSDVTFLNYPIEKMPTVRNAYFNSIRYCDYQLGRLVQHLEDEDILDDVILVVLGENGEAFHEWGTVGHGQEPIEPAVHVATVIHAPRYVEPGTEDYPTESIDLLPTVLGAIDWPSHPNFQGINVLADARPKLEERLLFFHVNNAIAKSDAVMLAGRWKYMQDLETGQTGLFDLKTDPAESKNVKGEHPKLAAKLDRVLSRWQDRQLAYYHYRRYYSKAYPPQAPKWKPDSAITIPAVIAP